MKKTFSLFLSMVLVLGVFLSVPLTESPFKITANAASSGTCGSNVTWTLDNGVLTISGTGAMKEYDSQKSVPWYSSSSSITSCVVKNGVTTVGAYTLYYLVNMKSVKLPNSLTSIASNAFQGCRSLVSITVASNNQNYSSINGVLFNKTGRTLICYPLGKTETSYVVPSNVTSINGYAFYNCQNLTSITIPTSLTSINASAFSQCLNLSAVYYMGTSSEWSNITVSAGNNYLTNATKTYNTCYIKGNCSSFDYVVESAHNYAVNTSKEWIINIDSASSISLTFSSSTKTESNYDYIYIYNASGTQVGKYCGTDLAGRTISVSGSTVKIRLTSDGSSQYYGFKISSIETVCGHSFSGGVCRSCGAVESDHNYKTNTDKEWTIQRPGSSSISLTFSDDTKTESNWDYIYIYNGSGTQVGRYSGTDLAGRTVNVSGSTARIRFTSDGSNEYYGFRITKVQNTVCTHTSVNQVMDFDATCTAIGSKDSICSVCGSTIETITIAAKGHTASSWITDKAATVNAAGSKYKRCTVCGKTLETAVIAQLTCATPTLSSAMNANGGVMVTWRAVSGADSYRVYRKTASSGWSCINSKVTSTSYTDKTAKSSTTYYYTVRAENEAGLSGYNSTGVSVKYLAMPVVTLSNTTTGIKVSWGKIAGATGYYVYRKANGEWSQCATISDGSKVSYTDTNVKNGSTYSYSVMAYDSTTTSDYNSTGVSVKHLATPTVTVANASTGVKVSWNKISGASKYYVYRKASGATSWTRLTDSATGTSYTDKTAKSGTTYYYMVKAVSGSSVSSYISSPSLKYLAVPKVSSLSNANSGITVKWDKITGASGYYVYRKTGSGNWSLIYTAKSGSTVSYTDKSAKAGTTYCYTVRAYSGSVKSTFISSTAIRRLTTPTLKSVSSASSGITFKWNKVTGASGYYVYRKTGSGTWQKIATVKSGSTVSYLDKTAKKGTTYTYTLRAYYSSSMSYFDTTGLKIKDKY